MRSSLLPLTLVALFACTETALALTISDDLHDAADDFSLLAGNANGVWTYGSLDSAGAFTVFTESFTAPGTSITSWRRNEAGTGTPGFYFNAGANLFFNGETELQIVRNKRVSCGFKRNTHLRAACRCAELTAP